MARHDRPLSPHLDVYRWEISNTLSILHRATGIMLSFGAIALVGWLMSVAAGPQAYATLNGFFAGPIGGLMLFGWTFCFFYHLCNGIRHLAWDTGRGFEKERARMTGWLVVSVAIVMTLGVWIAVFAA